MSTPNGQPGCDVTSQLTGAMQRRDWTEVVHLMDHGQLTEQQRRWVLEEASKLCDDLNCLRHLVTHCADDTLEVVLRDTVTRGIWPVVGDLLQRGVSDVQLQWVIQQACERTEEGTIIDELMPHFPLRQQEFMLTQMVTHGRWRAVGHMLMRGVSDTQHWWAVEEASKRAEEQDLISFILPRCAHEQLENFVTQLCERGLWRAVGEVLKENRDPVLNKLIVYESTALARGDVFLEHILPNCIYSAELDSLLSCPQMHDQKHWSNKLLHVVFGYGLGPIGQILKTAVSDVRRGRILRDLIALTDRFEDPQQFTKDILVHCRDVELESLLTSLLERRLWGLVGAVLERGVSGLQRNRAVQEACKRAQEWEIIRHILPHCAYERLDSAMKELRTRRLRRAVVVLLLQGVTDTLHRWAVVEDNTEPADEPFWNLVSNPCCEMEVVMDLSKSAMWSELKRPLETRLDWDPSLCQVFCESVVEIMKQMWLLGQGKGTELEARSAAAQAKEMLAKIHDFITEKVRDNDANGAFNFMTELRQLCCGQTKSTDSANHLFAIHFLKNLIQCYYKRRKWTASTEAILVILTTAPVVPDVQSVALRVMLRHKRWDVISLACLSHVWEQVRRELFQAAVEQRQWSVVKQWADHSLYDDQRWWALEESFREKQWDVYLLLADHGLTEAELMSVHHRIAKYAGWAVIRQMFERGADVIEAREVLEGATRQGRRHFGIPMNERARQRNIRRLVKLEKQLRVQSSMVPKDRTQLKWCTLLFELFHSPEKVDIHLALKTAREDNAWNVVMQLAKLGANAALRDSLFPEMVRRRQWGVCRALLERGVSVELCQAALQDLMAMNQWTLVARVMEFNVDDAVRRQVMRSAIERREGSVVWQCLMNREGDRLTEQEREDLFHRALSREIWQAVKPLVEEKDDTGVKHRDTALLVAIERHLWDLVDHCQRHHADINVKDVKGDTLIHRAAQKPDWEAAVALTKRDGDPSLLDSVGLSVLHRAIRGQQWDIVKLLIQFHGDIHQSADAMETIDEQNLSTPLGQLIRARQGELIEHTLLWCPDQWKGEGNEGETTLHAVCLSGWPDTLYYLVARGVDPLTVSWKGYSALSYAVLCKECAQKMVAECVKLGFSTHQPDITDDSHALWSVSPLALSVLRGLPVVTQMLYESGACSHRDLFRMHEELTAITDPGNREGYYEWAFFTVLDIKVICGKNIFEDRDKKLVERSGHYLMKMAVTPRSLKCMCRLVISHCLDVHDKRRHIHIMRLPILNVDMKNYVMFSDLTDPDYGQQEDGTDKLSDAEDFPDFEDLSDMSCLAGGVIYGVDDNL